MNIEEWKVYLITIPLAALLAFVIHKAIDGWRAVTWITDVVAMVRDDFVPMVETGDLPNKHTHIELTVGERDMIMVGRLRDDFIFRLFSQEFESMSDEGDWFDVKLIAIERNDRCLIFEVKGRRKHEF